MINNTKKLNLILLTSIIALCTTWQIKPMGQPGNNGQNKGSPEHTKKQSI